MPDDLHARLMRHFVTVARAVLDDDASDDEVAFEARVLYGQFLGWTPSRSMTLH